MFSIKKHFVMYLLNTKKLFVQKNYSKEKTGGETRVNSF